MTADSCWPLARLELCTCFLNIRSNIISYKPIFFIKMHWKVSLRMSSTIDIWMQDQGDRLCLVAHSPRNHRHNNGYLNRQSEKKCFKMTHQILDGKYWKTLIFLAPSSPTTPVPHLSWLIWETMVFTAHLSLNDMGFGLGNLRPMNLWISPLISSQTPVASPTPTLIEIAIKEESHAIVINSISKWFDPLTSLELFS